MPLSASWTISLCSARIAAWLALVILPRSWAASETELGLGERPAMERDLLAGVAHLGAQVVAMDVGQPLAGDQPEPEVERHGRGVAGVLGEPLADVEIGLLEDVGRIDPAGEPAVEPQADHPPEPLAIAVEERGQRRLVAGQGAAEEKIRVVARRIGHRSAP